MANDMATPTELAGYVGAPFTDAQVDAAVLSLQNLLGWHLAPVATETITFDHDGGRTLILPSRKVVTVDEVRDVSGDTPQEITGYRLSPAGFLTGWWPCGTAVLEVDLTHGYDATPADVFPAIAALAAQLNADGTVRQVSIDDFATTFRSDITRGGGAVSNVISFYGLPREF